MPLLPLVQELPVLLLLTLLALLQAAPSDAAKKARADLDIVRKGIENMMQMREKDQKLVEQLQAGSDDEERLKKILKLREDLKKEFTELRGTTVKGMEDLIAATGE